MEEKDTFLSPIIKLILFFTVILLTGILLVMVGNPFKKVLAPFVPNEVEGTLEPKINAIEVHADAIYPIKRYILNSETKSIIFTTDDTQKYLKDSGYFYNSGTFQNTNAKYAGECFLDAVLSNNKDRIVFSIGCLPGDLPQSWIGIYDLSKVIPSRSCISLSCSGPGREPDDYCIKQNCILPAKAKIKFLVGGSGRDFIWSADDKTITYEADLGLSGMTETKAIDSVTGEILTNKNKSNISDFDNFIGVTQEEMPKDLVSFFIQDQKGNDDGFCGQKKVVINDFEFVSESVDLNGDGIKEFIITLGRICGGSIRGASGNGPIIVYQKINDSWLNAGTIEGNSYAVKLEKSVGYQKIVTYWHLSAVSGTITYYKWNSDKMTYEEETTKEINLNNN